MEGGKGEGGRTRGGWRKMEKMEEENKWKDKQGIYLKNQLFLCLSSYSTKQMKGKDTAGNARKHDTVPSTFVYLDVFRAMITNTDIHAYIGHKT